MKNKVNTILGYISITAAIGMLADIVYCYVKYHAQTNMDNIMSCAAFLSVGAVIMGVIGMTFMKSSKDDPYKHIAIMILLLAAAVYGTLTVNSMLKYVIASQ